jgi:hypothetical protein
MNQHVWILNAIQQAYDPDTLMRIQRIIKFEKEQGVEYTSSDEAMNELRSAWKRKMDELLSEVSSDAQTAT